MIFRFIYQKRRRNKPSGPYVEELRRSAKASLPPRLKAFADAYGFAFNRVTIKNNISSWGSCSTKGNINLSLYMMKLPEHLQDFVMLHELCHLKYPNHGKEFHKLLDSVCLAQGLGKEKDLRKSLKDYHTL